MLVHMKLKFLNEFLSSQVGSGSFIRLFYCELVVTNTPSLIYYQFWLKFVTINASAL